MESVEVGEVVVDFVLARFFGHPARADRDLFADAIFESAGVVSGEGFGGNDQAGAVVEAAKVLEERGGEFAVAVEDNPELADAAECGRVGGTEEGDPCGPRGGEGVEAHRGKVACAGALG